MPRPKKRPADRKEIVLKVRVTDEQQRRLQRAAHKAGLELSSWMRSVALAAAGEKLPDE